MGGVMGPQAYGLLVLGVLLACGHLIHGSQYYGEGYTVRCTIGIQVTIRPPNGYFDACKMMSGGLAPGMVGPQCKVVSSNEQGYYVLYEVAFKLEKGDTGGYHSSQYLTGAWNVPAADAAVYGGTFVPGTLQCFDIDECTEKSSQCSPNAACYNDWATYTCTCLDGYKDYSEPGSRRGYRCDKEEVRPSDRPQLDVQIWVYVLVAIAILVVLMLLICCCCCYSGSSDCCPSMHQARTRVIKHVKIIPQQVQAPCPPPPCICKPPEEKKIIIQVDQAPQSVPAPASVMPVEPMVTGPSAFIANSGYDGKVYVADHQAQVTRALPWADGCSMQTVNPPVQYIQQQQPQQVQLVQQPVYDQPITTPYVYNVDVDPSSFYMQ